MLCNQGQQLPAVHMEQTEDMVPVVVGEGLAMAVEAHSDIAPTDSSHVAMYCSGC